MSAAQPLAVQPQVQALAQYLGEKRVEDTMKETARRAALGGPLVGPEAPTAFERVQAALGGLRQRAEKAVARTEEPGRAEIEDVGRALLERPLTPVPFVSGVDSVFRLAALNAASKAAQAGTATGEQMALLESEAQKAAAGQEGGTVPYWLGTIATQLPAWAGEFAATSGAFTPVKKGVETGLLKAAGKAGERAATKAAAKLIGTAAGAATQTAAMPHRFVESYLQRQLQEEDPSLLKALGDVYVEVLSERGGAAAKYLPGAKQLGRVRRVVMQDWLKLHPGSGVAGFLDKVRSKAGWHGVLGEFGEERLAEFLRAGTGLDEEYQPPSAAQMVGELGAFALPGAMGTAARAAATKEAPRAVEEGQQPGRDLGQYPQVDRGELPAEAGRGDRARAGREVAPEQPEPTPEAVEPTPVPAPPPLKAEPTPEVTPAPAATAAKEPWQMTRPEYERWAFYDDEGHRLGSDDLRSYRSYDEVMKQALSEGKPVPAEEGAPAPTAAINLLLGIARPPKGDSWVEAAKRNLEVGKHQEVTIGFDEDGKPVVVDGNSRIAAAQEMGLQSLPVRAQYPEDEPMLQAWLATERRPPHAVEPAEEGAPAPEAKQPWQMTQEEFFSSVPDTSLNWGLTEQDKINIHKGIVADALSGGEPVPTEVLAEYPDLAPAPAAAVEPAPAPEPTLPAEAAPKPAPALAPVEPGRPIEKPPGAPTAPAEVARVGVQRVSGETIAVMPEAMQFKRMDDTATGINEEDRLRGEWDELKGGLLLLWEPANPDAYDLQPGQRYIIANGHHRFAFGQEQGVSEYNAQVLREADGVTLQDAVTTAAEINIADGKGTIYDQARFIRNTAAVHGEAEARASAARTGIRGKKAASIALGATENTFTSFINEQITPEQAAAIAEAAPKKEQAQAQGIRRAVEGLHPQDVGNVVRAALTMGADTSTGIQMDLLGEDVSINDEMERRRKIASQRQREISDQLNAVRGAAKRPEQARRLGVDVKDPVAVQAKVQQLRQLQERWRDWHLFPDLVAEVTGIETERGVQEVLPGMAARGGTRATAQVAPEGGPAGEPGPVGEPYQPGQSNAPTAAVVEMPELTRLATELGRGKRPQIKKKLRAMHGTALGVFRHQEGGEYGIGLRADIFIGPPLASTVLKQRATNEDVSKYQESVAKDQDLDPDEVLVQREYDRRHHRHILIAYKKDATYANRAMAHEIGHMVDFLPEKTMKRGNILGRMKSLKNFLATAITSAPESPEQALTPQERRQGRSRIQKEVRAELGRDRDKDEFRALVKERYGQWVQQQVEERGLVTRDELMTELKALSQWWSPFEPTADGDYTKYRHKGKELYADAFSVLMNNPEALKTRAPKFWQTWHNYLDQKPEVRDLYNEIQDEIRGGQVQGRRLDDYYAMLERGEQKRGEVAGKRGEGKTIHDRMTQLASELLVDNAALIRKERLAEKQGREIDPEDRPSYWAEDIIHLNCTSTQMWRDVTERVSGPLEQAGAEMRDLGVFLGLRRAATERKWMANPLGIRGEQAEQLLSELRDRLGPEKYRAVEAAAADWFKVRQEYVIPILEHSGYVSDELMQLIKDNENYATFNVQDYIDDTFGGNTGARIYRQIGTLEDIEDSFTASLLKDLSLIRAAVVNDGKRSLVGLIQSEFPGDTQDAAKKWNGQYWEFVEPTDRDSRLMIVMKQGKAEGHYIPAELAEWYERDQIRAAFVAKALRYSAAPFRAIWTSYNPGFGIWNLQRDFRAACKKLPGPAHKMPFKLVATYAGTFRDAALDAFADKSTPLVRELYRQNALIAGRHYEALERQGLETEYERQAMSYALGTDKATSPWGKALSGLNRFNAFMERWSKIASGKYLKTEFPQMGPKQLAHIVRHRGGSPDFLTGGKLRMAYNNLFMFSNAQTQDLRASAEAIRENWSSYLIKTALYDILPKVMGYALATGAAGAIYRHIYGRDDEEDWIKKVLDRVPQQDKENYQIVPLGLTEDDEAVYIALPSDHVGQLVGNIVWTSLEQSKNARPEDFGDILQAQLPFSTTNMNPFLKVAADFLQYAAGRNPYDPFYGSTMIPETVFEAGGLRALKELGKSEWNRLFGQLYRFRRGTASDIKGDVAKILDIPVAGPFMRRFVRVSRKGLDDALRRELEVVTKEQARKSVGIGDIVAKRAKEVGRDARPYQILRAKNAAWSEARDQGIIWKGYTRATFNRRFDNAYMLIYGSAEEKAMRFGSRAEREYVRGRK